MTTNLQDQLWRAWACSVPLVAVTTADPEATQRLVTELAESKQRPAIRWDPATGYLALTEAGDRLLQSRFPTLDVGDPLEALKLLRQMPEFSLALIYCLNPEAFFERPSVLQATWNLRPLFSKANKLAIFICPPSLKLPTALQHDFLVLAQPLPSESELTEMVSRLYTDNSVPDPDEAVVAKAGAILRGLGPFDALQATSLAMTERGIDIQSLWQRKKQFVRNIRGLEINEEDVTLDDIGGNRAVIQYNIDLFNGPEPPLVVVQLEEFARAMAGTVGDLSGVSQSIEVTLLTGMEDMEWEGELFMGVQGSGKSLLAKALAKTFGVLGLRLDLGGTKEGIVGSSEANIRVALKTIEAIAGPKRALFVGTLNQIGEGLSPAMQRRFPTRFFFDVPTREEREKIWPIHLKRYGLTESPSDALLDEDLSGSDMRDLCRHAYKLRCSLEQARQYITPVMAADPQEIERLRSGASGRFLSASQGGTYRYTPGSAVALASTEAGKRKLQFH